MASPATIPVNTTNCPDPCCDCPDERPIIGLDQFAECLCFHEDTKDRFHFWQLAQDPNNPTRIAPGTPVQTRLTVDPFSPCESIVFQANGHGEGLNGRDEIWRAIKMASELFIQEFYNHTGYFPVERFSCYEYNPTNYAAVFNSNVNYSPIFEVLGSSHLPYVGTQRVFGHGITLPHRKIRKFGKKVNRFVVTMTATPGVTLLDLDNDGIFDTAELRIAKTQGSITINSAEEIRLYFTEADRTSDELLRNEIRPLKVVHDPIQNNFIARFPARLAVKPTAYRQAQGNALDPNDRNIYARHFDLYQEGINENLGVIAMRKLGGCGCYCGCPKSDETRDAKGCWACTQSLGCTWNAELGQVIISKAGQDCCSCCPECVDRYCINYLSGCELDIY